MLLVFRVLITPNSAITLVVECSKQKILSLTAGDPILALAYENFLVGSE